MEEFCCTGKRLGLVLRYDSDRGGLVTQEVSEETTKAGE